SPDGRLLAAGSGLSLTDWEPSTTPFEQLNRTSFVHLYDVSKGTLLAAFASPGADIGAVTFTPDGRFLVYTGADRVLHSSRVKTRKQAAALAGHLGAVRCLAFAADGRTLATGSADGTVRFWPWQQLLERPPAKRSKK